MIQQFSISSFTSRACHRYALPFLALTTIFLLSACTRENAGESISEAANTFLHPDEYRATILKTSGRADPLLSLYRDPQSRETIISLFSAIVNSDTIARIILEEADSYNLAPALMTAVAWEESRFNINAVNRNANSIDRGLFQLNSLSFPNLTETDFFDPALNTRYAASHLRWCLDYAGSEVAALAMYNAGTARVQKGQTPKKTLDYVSRILAFKEGVHSLSDSELLPFWNVTAEGIVQAQSSEKVAIHIAKASSAVFATGN